MAFINADRIKETTITTGTEAITLAGAVLGFRAFYPTLSVGATFKYFMVSTSGTEWEAGLGKLTASSTLERTTVQSSSNANAAVNFSAGLKEVGIGPTAGGETPWNPVTNTLDISVNALNDVAITSPTVNQVLKYSGTEWTNQADAVNVGTVTSVSGAGTVSGLTLTGTVTSSGSLTLGGAISTLNQNTTGNAATVTTNANLTGHITSTGNAAVLGSFTSAQLAGALTDETGTGAAVFATSPTLITPLSNTLSAIPVTVNGPGNNVTIAAGDGVSGATSNPGGSIILQPGAQGSGGGNGSITLGGTNVVVIPDAGIRFTGQNTACLLRSGNDVTVASQAGVLLNILSTGVTLGAWSGSPKEIRTSGNQSGNTNRQSAPLVFYSTGGTGSGAAGYVSIVVAGTGAATTTVNAEAEIMRITSTGVTVNNVSAIPVTSGAGNSLTIAAGSGIGATGTNNGANLILNPGEFANLGTRGTVLIDGLNAGKSKSSGVDNTVFGIGALAAITTGPRNVAIGNRALSSVTTNEQNVAIGADALFSNTTSNNTAVGVAASYFNVYGTANVAVGYAALYRGTSAYNVGIGFGALENATSAANNVAIGYQAGKSNNAITTGSSNTLVGSNAGIGPTFEGSNNCIIIGANAIGNGTNTTTIGNTSTTNTYLYGTISAIPVASGAGNSVTIAAGAGVGTGAGGSLILQAGIQATSGGDGKVIVKQVAGQTSNLQEWQNSAGTALGAFDSSGRLVVGKGIATVGIRFQSHEESTQNINYFSTGGAYNSTHTFATNINGVGRAGIIGFDYSDNVLKLIYGGSFGGQIAGLNINSSNNVGLGTVGPLAKLHAVAGAAATKGLIVQGAASQTAALQEWQNSAGTVLASVNAAGNFSGSAAGLTNFPTLNQNTTGTASNVTGVVAVANGGTNLAVIGSSKQILGVNAAGTALEYTGPYCFSYYKSVSQTLTGNVSAKITFETSEFDTTGSFANSRFTPQIAGYYHIEFVLQPSAGNGFYGALGELNKNGVSYKYVLSYLTTAIQDDIILNLSTIVYLNGTTDYIEVFATRYGNTNAVAFGVNPMATFISGHLLR